MSDLDRGAATLPIRNRPGQTVKFHQVPLFNSVSAARWSDRSNMDYPEGAADKHVAAPTPDPLGFGAVVDGDCMEPDYPNGWVAIFSPAEVEELGMIEGREYFVQLDGDGDGENTFKRLMRVDGDELVFRCINPRYPEEIRVRSDRIIRAAIAVDCVRYGGRRRQA
jgi:SOS-response transcriptional repressor LexA